MLSATGRGRAKPPRGHPEEPMKRCKLMNGSLLAALIVVALAAIAVPQNQTAAQVQFPAAGESVHFALTAADDKAVTEQNFRGKWLVVYFGYTFCPDVCPTTMLEIAGALKALGARADAVQAIFISVDPQRDTPKVLNEYLKSFDPRLIGLTGTPA